MNGLFSLRRKTSIFLDVVALLEAVDSSGRIYKLLLAGEKRVASRANFNVDVLRGRSCLDHVSARALDLGGVVRGMNSFSHGFLQIWMALIDAPRNSGLKGKAKIAPSARFGFPEAATRLPVARGRQAAGPVSLEP
jgi:hypothetical protein